MKGKERKERGLSGCCQRFLRPPPYAAWEHICCVEADGSARCGIFCRASLYFIISSTSGGKGTGSALVKALCDYGESHGLVFITLEVRPSNQAALALYRKFGFCQEGIRKNYYRRPTEDAWLLTRRFSPSTDRSKKGTEI